VKIQQQNLNEQSIIPLSSTLSIDAMLVRKADARAGAIAHVTGDSAASSNVNSASKSSPNKA
jgi:hypothetical protein